MTWLYRFEAQGIQAYILGHRKLKRLLGASALVEGLVERLRSFMGARVLYGAAGGATLRFDSEDEVQRFAGLWTAAVAEYAPLLSLVQAWSPEANGLQALHERLRLARRQPVAGLPAGSPVVDRSPRGLPAVPQVELADDKQSFEVLDAPGQRAREEERDRRDAFEAAVLGPALGARFRFADDMAEVAGGHYLAVIHADGNAVGKLLQSGRWSTVAGRAVFTQELKNVSEQALRGALEKLHPDKDPASGKKGVLLGVPIIFGGDDLTIVVRADRAMAFLVEFVQRFEAETRAAFGQRIQMSAGVAFVRRNHAFHLAHELAHDLCDSAKKGSNRQHSTVRFYRFTELHAEEAEAYGGPYLLMEDKPTDDLLPLAPLRAAADRLVERGLSRGPVRKMLEALEREDPEAQTDESQRIWQRIGEVQKDEARQVLYRELDAVWPGLSKKPWLDRGEKWRRPKGAPKLRLEQHFSPWPDLNTLAVVQEGSDD